jgi:hypothetical protein
MAQSNETNFKIKTECEAPLGRIVENWFYDTDGNSFTCSEGEFFPCCGPLRNFTSCYGYGSTKLQDVWSTDGVCSGYSIYDCCFEENGYILWNFTDCEDSQTRIDGAWNVNGTCLAYYYDSCCETQYTYTDCPTYWEPISGQWSNGVCYGASLYDCCDDFVVLESSSSGLSVDFWIFIVVAILICIPCSCITCSCCPYYHKFHSHPAVIHTGKIFKTASKVISTVETVTNSVNNVTDIVSTVQGGDEENTIVVLTLPGSETASSDNEEGACG